ncbi:hypothetical protein DENSPDRAFT_450997 [Dentipellis sp. KUC8613]|nr:hypothetical protein DENSPDRAFT_450997 [Dentipellis sp. KUC8613]
MASGSTPSLPLSTPPTSPAAPASPTSSPPTSTPPPSSTSSSSSTTTTSSTSSSSSSSSSSETSTSTTSSSSSFSSSSSSTPAAASSPSSTPPTSAAPTSSTPSQTFSTHFQVGTSNGIVFTETSIATISGPTASGGAANRSSGGFFHNKGAVAGVFTVVGLVVAVIAVVLVTSAVRRRRAKKFDKEIDEAAAEAAAAHGPDFDDYDYTSGNTGYGGYSDGSHGTFAQPPMSHSGEAYRMADMAPQNYYSDASSTTGVGAGAAGIGAAVGAAAMQRARSSRRDTQDPYLKFGTAGAPDPAQYDAPPPDSTLRYRGNAAGDNPSFDILEAAGLGGVSGGDPYAIARGPSMRGTGAGMPDPGIARNQSLSGRDALSSESHYSGGSAQMPQPQSQPPFASYYGQQPQQPPAQYGNVPPQQPEVLRVANE